MTRSPLTVRVVGSCTVRTSERLSRRADPEGHLAGLDDAIQIPAGEGQPVSVHLEADRRCSPADSRTRAKPISWVAGRVTLATGSAA